MLATGSLMWHNLHASLETLLMALQYTFLRGLAFLTLMQATPPGGPTPRGPWSVQGDCRSMSLLGFLNSFRHSGLVETRGSCHFPRCKRHNFRDAPPNRFPNKNPGDSTTHWCRKDIFRDWLPISSFFACGLCVSWPRCQAPRARLRRRCPSLS